MPHMEKGGLMTTVVDRVITRLDCSTDGCWIWPGSKTPGGYGTVSDGPKTRYVHRVMYEMFVGPIPAGFDLDHLCRTRSCARPDHLEAVNRSTNLMRGAHRSALAVQTGKCLNGHEYTPDNTYVTKRGTRTCKACRRIPVPA